METEQQSPMNIANSQTDEFAYRNNFRFHYHRTKKTKTSQEYHCTGNNNSPTGWL